MVPGQFRLLASPQGRESISNRFVGAPHFAQAACPVQHARELLDRVGLLQQLETVAAVFRQYVAVTAGQHDRQVGMAAPDFLGQFDAGHPGHHDVREHRVETVRADREFFERMRGVADERGGVAEFGQRVGGELSDLGIVLDDEH